MWINADGILYDGDCAVGDRAATSGEIAIWEAGKAAAAEQQRVDRLWQAAHDYEYAQVSGSAIGLLAIGVMQGKPKCIAVQNWIRTIWTEYYTRKASGSTDYYYLFAGAIPYTVPELMAELGL